MREVEGGMSYNAILNLKNAVAIFNFIGALLVTVAAGPPLFLMLIGALSLLSNTGNAFGVIVFSVLTIAVLVPPWWIALRSSSVTSAVLMVCHIIAVSLLLWVILFTDVMRKLP
jgi:hypothetical protein